MCVCEDVTPAVWAATSRWFIRFPSAPGCLCYANKVFVCVIVYVSGRSSPTLKGFVRIAGICYVMLYVWEHSVTCGIPCKWGYGRCITYFHVWNIYYIYLCDDVWVGWRMRYDFCGRRIFVLFFFLSLALVFDSRNRQIETNTVNLPKQAASKMQKNLVM